LTQYTPPVVFNSTPPPTPLPQPPCVNWSTYNPGLDGWTWNDSIQAWEKHTTFYNNPYLLGETSITPDYINGVDYPYGNFNRYKYTFISQNYPGTVFDENCPSLFDSGTWTIIGHGDVPNNWEIPDPTCSGYGSDITTGTTNALFDFKISDMPPITNATLMMYYGGTLNLSYDPTGLTVQVYDQPRGNWSFNQSTWFSYKTGSSWTSVGGDYNGTPAEATIPASPGWVSWNVTDIVMKQQAEGRDATFLIKQKESTTSSYMFDPTTIYPSGSGYNQSVLIVNSVYGSTEPATTSIVASTPVDYPYGPSDQQAAYNYVWGRGVGNDGSGNTSGIVDLIQSGLINSDLYGSGYSRALLVGSISPVAMGASPWTDWWIEDVLHLHYYSMSLYRGYLQFDTRFLHLNLYDFVRDPCILHYFEQNDFVTIKNITNTYYKNEEYLKLKKLNITVKRKYIVEYLKRYKWFNDNFKEKHKDIRSVLLNYIIQ